MLRATGVGGHAPGRRDELEETRGQLPPCLPLSIRAPPLCTGLLHELLRDTCCCRELQASRGGERRWYRGRKAGAGAGAQRRRRATQRRCRLTAQVQACCALGSRGCSQGLHMAGRGAAKPAAARPAPQIGQHRAAQRSAQRRHSVWRRRPAPAHFTHLSALPASTHVQNDSLQAGPGPCSAQTPVLANPGLGTSRCLYLSSRSLGVRHNVPVRPRLLWGCTPLCKLLPDTDR